MVVLIAALVAGTVAPIRDGNALTLPAARHLVRMEQGGGRPAVWMLAIQQDGADGHGLVFLRSTDGGNSWSYYAPIQNDSTERDTPDLVPVGSDIALVYSYEGPTLGGSIRHDVYFQWWRSDGAGGFRPDAHVLVFDSTSSATAFYRGELAIDSVGRIWVQAMKLESDGTSTAAIAVSTDGGRSFARQPDLARTTARAGGRILSLGSSLVFFWGTHGGVDPGRMRTRRDSDPLSSWTAATVVLSEGIYHGAALSAVTDGRGGFHLAYKSLTERLYYRHFDGAAWSAATLVETVPDWATQPALTRLGNDLVLFYNHPVTTMTDYRFYYRTIRNGVLGPVQQLDGSSGFKGYPASVDVLPTSIAQVPCIFGKTPDAATSGNAVVVFGTAPAPTAPPPPPPSDAGIPDAGVPDSGVPDAGAPDAGTGGPPPPAGDLLFADAFDRNASTLGPAWNVTSGAWIVDLRANADRNTLDRASVAGISCADCRIDGRLIGFATPECGFTLREQPGGDRYDLVLTSAGRVRIRRWRSGAATILGDAPSGLRDLTIWASFAFAASGSMPVTLTATVDGVQALDVSDATPQAIGTAGAAGLTASAAGTPFDQFRLTALGAGPPADGGIGGADAGGQPDGGVADAGSTDGGVADGGSPDGGTGGGGAPPGTVLFADAFNRNDAHGLGAAWTVASGAFITDMRANSDRNMLDRAYAAGVQCLDCRLDARLVGFGTELAVTLRSSPLGTAGDRYDAAITSSGRLRIRRWRSGAATVLGDVASGLPDLTEWASISFTVVGTSPVILTAAVNGQTRLTVTDGSASAIAVPGYAGFTATVAGVVFDDFRLSVASR
jgi:hypothetical protein